MKRKPARWMCTLDERIIEHVDENAWASPKTMEQAIKFNASERRIRERCKMLSDVGLIAPIYEGADMYEITAEGQEYLDGDLDVEHLPRPSQQALRG